MIKKVKMIILCKYKSNGFCRLRNKEVYPYEEDGCQIECEEQTTIYTGVDRKRLMKDNYQDLIKSRKTDTQIRSLYDNARSKTRDINDKYSIISEMAGIILIKSKKWKHMDDKEFCYLIRLMYSMNFMISRAVQKRYRRKNKIDFANIYISDAQKKLKVFKNA